MKGCRGWVRKITRPTRSPRTAESPTSRRERQQALIAELLNTLELDDPPGHLPGLHGGFRFQIPLPDAGNPTRTLTVTFAKAGYRTFTLTALNTHGHEQRLGVRTLRGDLPVHRAAAELVLTLFGPALPTTTP